MNIKIIKNDDGYLARCADIQRAFAEGTSEFEAFYNLIDVIAMIIEYKHIGQNNFSEKSLEFNIPLSVS